MVETTSGPPPPDRQIARFLRHTLRSPIATLPVFESAALFFVPFEARWLLRIPSGIADIPGAIEFVVVTVIALLAMGLYSRRQRAGAIGILSRVAAAVVFASAAIGFLSYIYPPLAVERPVFLLSGPLAVFACAVIRYGFERFFDEAYFKRRVLVYGVGQRAISVMQLRRRSDTRGFLVVGFVATEGDKPLVDRDRVVSPPGGLLRYCLEADVDEIVMAMDDRRRAFPVHELLECRLAGIVVTELVDFLESETGKVHLSVLNPSWIIFAPGFSRSQLRQFTERSLDLASCLVLLAVAWPVMLAAALAILIEDGISAPVLYQQVRVGLEGRRFNVLKFRSMRIDAEGGGKPIWATAADPRVTRVGGIMRKLRIDELPQLFNVLRGDMSFVGPRPERPEFVQELEQTVPYYRERHSVKPGITGWAQLCYPYGASMQDAIEKLQYDLYYVKNHSLLFDVMILLQTAEVVIWGKGAR